MYSVHSAVSRLTLRRPASPPSDSLQTLATNRPGITSGAVAILLLAAAFNTPVVLQAQDPPPTSSEAGTLTRPDTLPRVTALEGIVVIGTRRGGRTAIESYSPVHVVSGATVRAQGGADLLDMLRTVVPAFNVNAQPIADGASIVRPPNVRNLAADHTLVLVNGQTLPPRGRHRLAGSQGFGRRPGARPVGDPLHRAAAGRGAAGRGGGPVRFRRDRRRHELRSEGRPRRVSGRGRLQTDHGGRRKTGPCGGQRGTAALRGRVREPELRVGGSGRNGPQCPARRRG